MIAHTQIKDLGKTIDPTIDHEDQSMKISSFFNTHTDTRYPFGNELSQTTFYLPTLQVVVQLDQLAQGYPTQILGEGVVYWKTNLFTNSTYRSGTTWWYFQEDIWKITIHRHVIKIENNLAFQGKMI